MTARRSRHASPDSSSCQASSPSRESSDQHSTGDDSKLGSHFTTERHSRKKVETRRRSYRSNSGSDVEAIQFEPLASAPEEDQSGTQTREESGAGSDDDPTASNSAPVTYLRKGVRYTKPSLPGSSGSRTLEDSAIGKGKVQRGKVVRIPLATPEPEEDEDLLADMDEDGEQRYQLCRLSAKLTSMGRQKFFNLACAAETKDQHSRKTLRSSNVRL